MAYTGNSSKAVSSSFLYSTLQTFYTKIKGLLDNKADKTALNSINPNAINGGYTKNSFYINTHPENSGAIIPFINNDIAFLLKRGGSAKIYYDDVVQSADISNVFDGSPSYWAIDPTDVTKVVIELTLHKTFTWTNTIYVDFGSAGWRAKSVSIDVMNTGNSETTWTNKSTITNNSIGQHKITFSHNDGKGFNKVRFTFSGWATSTIFRISCLGIVNYGSSGLRETFLPKDGGSVYGSITPYSNNSINLGNSSSKWSNVYATTFNGALSGNASTSTKATQDSAGQQINTTYIKGLSVSGKTITYTKGDNTTGTITTQDTNTTYSNATTSTAGLMSASDKSKLDAITASADAVSVTQKLTSGTEIGTVTINGTGTKLYAPTNTDTHYASKNVVGSTTATSNTTTALTNGNVYLNSVENGAVTSTHKISGSGATTVTTDASGNIVISSTDTNTNTTYSAGTGISLSGTTFSNSGVRSIASGTTNGTISVNTNGTSAEVAVKGLGSAAYTASTAYATSGHTHNYAGSSSAGGAATTALTCTGNSATATKSNSLSSTGFGDTALTYCQTDGSFYDNSGWCHYIIANHGNGSSYYNYTIGLPFYSTPIYQRQTGNTSSKSGWHKFYTSENITYGTSALTPGSSSLATGNIYLQYE